MPTNMQTSLATPVAGFSNGNDKQNLAVHVVGVNLGVTQVLALSATAQASSAFGAHDGEPVQVRVIGTQPFYLSVAANPTATSASPYFAASDNDTVVVVPDGQKISVLQAATGGSVWLTNVT